MDAEKTIVVPQWMVDEYRQRTKDLDLSTRDNRAVAKHCHERIMHVICNHVAKEAKK